MKRKIAGAILMSMLSGLGFAGKYIYNLDRRIEKVSSKSVTNETRLDKQEKKIDNIHWYLIERNNIKVPSKEK